MRVLVLFSGGAKSQQRIEDYQARGFEVHALIIDYGQDREELHEALHYARSFIPKHTLVTAHASLQETGRPKSLPARIAAWIGSTAELFADKHSFDAVEWGADVRRLPALLAVS
jgi:hypothetical protein